MYDPFDLFSPVTQQGKIYLHALRNKRLEGDELLPVQDEIQWLKIETNRRELSNCYSPRYIGLCGDHKPTSQLLVFCDASKYAYTATVYLRQQTSDMCIKNLILKKARLAPNHEISIPRLELSAALIGVRCIKFVEREREN